jgi:amidohydrolase
MDKLDQWKEQIFREIDRLAPEIIAHNDDLADHPELSGAEHKSSKKIVKILRKYGFEVKYPFVGIPAAFEGSLKGKGKHKIAFLLEYDALPGLAPDGSGRPGHACGHCVSGSIGLLAGLGFSAVKEAITGELDLIGTPAEETNGAKADMAKRGVFDLYDLAIMIHMADRNRVLAKLLAMNALEFTFTGKVSHAAVSPWEGKNALNGVQLMFHAVDMLRQHVLSDTRIHGIISQGGETPNIVPEKATARFYVRAPKRCYVNQVVEMVKNCAKGAGIATQTTVKIRTFEQSFEDMLPNPAGELLLADIYQELGLEISKELPDPGSSDIGNVSHRCPALHPYLAITRPGVGLHTRDFAAAVKGEKAHQAIIDGAKILALTALKVFHDEPTRKAIAKDFQSSRQMR